jgi:hypothetical protein
MIRALPTQNHDNICQCDNQPKKADKAEVNKDPRAHVRHDRKKK